jgi:hypothetical protein
MSKGGIASLKLFLKSTVRHRSSRQAEYTPSTFDIHHSIFAFEKFLTDQTGRSVTNGWTDNQVSES